MDCFKTKKAGEVLDYVQDWAAWLGSDTIVTSVWSVTGGMVVDSDSIGSPAQTATVWLSGGTFGTTAEAINSITTAAGRTAKATIAFRIV